MIGFLLRSSLLLALGFAALVPCTGSEMQQPAAAKPRLVVLVVFDQLRGDYPTRWKELCGEGGFQRLMKEGTWFSNCHYSYALTVTGAGHASLATGCEPYRHGIIENDWYDRQSKTVDYCAKRSKYRKVTSVPGENKETEFGSPERLLVPTLADAWKTASAGKGKVVAVSLKDRGAVFTGGKKPDACYWADEKTGAFVTSTYYAADVAPWVAKFNAGKPADAWFGKEWTRLRADVDYAKYSSPDEQEGEGTGVKQGRAFPHPLTGGLDQPGQKYYEALANSPFGNELLWHFAKEAIAAEQLGQDDTPDFLSISYSSNDLIGHTWGPDSQEVLDVTLRTDALLAEMLQHLDTTVGKDRYLLVLSADHGVCPLPEVARAKGVDAMRLQPAEIAARAEAFLQAKYGRSKQKYIENASWPMFYVRRSLVQQRCQELGRQLGEVERALAGWLREQQGIQAVYTREALSARLPGGDLLGNLMQKSFHPAHSGDVFVVVKPHVYASKYLTGTGHGTPHEYDTHVPLIVFGHGVSARGERKGLVTPLAAPRILAAALGVDLPFATGELPPGVIGAPVK